ncbi:hypothetical protein EIJ81_00775 (plasmid) [Aliivibrio salmonicida]|uniref:hypothetical protein n=1 Tax=Aliivibrio salmonicida TaxID=40269 RepID=UPI000F6FFEB6|nr:hypothetical protein [Aliivibrio salmonicida]AZL83433.1 hypothetical protein EIJ81_00775 [Aliivibrio salmonicida]
MFKFKTKNLTLAVAIYSALVGSTYVHAKSVTVIGDLEAKSPKISLNQNSKTIEAFVEPAIINVFQDTDSGCELTTDVNIAKAALNDDGLNCHLKVVAPYKMKVAENATKTQYVLSGTIDKIGVTEIPVSSTFYSGSALSPILASSENLQITAIEPQPLTVDTLVLDAGYKKVTGINVIEINTPKASNSLKMQLDTELKSYARYINGGEYGKCDITLTEKGESLGCGIDLSKFTFGSTEDRLGEIVIPLFADAKNKYFESSNKKIDNSVTIKWDSRLPVDVGDLVGKAPLGTSMTTDDGTVITAAPGEWKTIVSTPHYSRSDNWWKLAAELTLTPTEGATTSAPNLIVNGQDLSYLWKSNSIPNLVTLTSAAVMNGKYAELSFDMSGVVEGVYDSHISIKDKLDNKIEIDRKASHIEKIAPEALFIVDGSQVYEGRVPQVYFANQIDFAIWSRFRKITIVGATIDGKPFEYKDVNGEGYHFKGVSLPKGLPFNSRLDFKVEYIDDRGVKGEIVKKIDVMPFSFTSRYLSGYSDVQEYGGDLRQADGRVCVFYDDLAKAKNDNFASAYELHCVVNWIDLDKGIKPIVESKRVILKGYLAEGQLEQKYSVTFFDFKGNKETTANSLISFEDIDTPPVRLEIVNGNVIKGDENKAFSIPLSGGTSAEVYASLVNGDAVISAVNPFGDDVVYVQDQLGYDSNTPPKAKIKIRSRANKLWETGILSVKAGYKHSTDYDTTEQMTMVYVPDSDVDMYYKSNQVQAINTKPFEITTGIGIYDKATKTYHYDAKVHGEWMVQLQQRVFGGAYENVGTQVLLPESGSYTFNVDSSALEGNESYKYRVISSIVSKYPGYSRTEEGKSITVKVVKGGPIDAVIEVSKTERLTPYKGKGTLKFSSSADSKAWGILSGNTVSWVRPVGFY